MTEKYTPWYDPKVDGQPVRVGFYEREYKVPQVDYWNGASWLYENEYGYKAIWQIRRWRGLTSPSEGYHV